ncbi:MAG TPA: hypothetical protein VHM26_19220 [Chitinophagaceae bacterium]|jgi:hypothetical protein|nr:hypothetical protein [Chitinophagaceae bacterium]
MKKLFLFTALLLSVAGIAQVNINGVKRLLGKKEKVAEAGNEKKAGYTHSSADTSAANTVDATNAVLTLNDVIKEAPGSFEGIKGKKTAHDDYGFGGDSYNTTKCIQGAVACGIVLSGFDATLKIRVGGAAMSWEDAEKTFKQWREKIMSITEWGKTTEVYANETYKTLKSDFIADRNVTGHEKYTKITVSLQTIYLDENTFRLILSIEN